MVRAFGQLKFGYGAFSVLRNASFAVLLPLAVSAEPVVIAAMGDSLTQGYGLSVEEGFVPQMQAWLDEAGVEVRMINAGVSGDTTAGGLSRAAWTLTPDVDAMIVALGANDYLRGIDPAVARENLTGILEVASEQDVAVLLVGLDVGANYGPEYKAEFDAIYPELSEQFATSLFPTWFEGLRNPDGVLNMQGYFQSDGLHPNGDGVAAIVAAMGPSVAALAASVD